MDNEDFILNIIKLYQKARETGSDNKKIRRGRSHPISANSEDLFALFLIDKINCDFIYVDQPISIVGRRGQIYPDIVIVKDGIITSFCDLKMDLGWKRRELFSFCKTKKNKLSQIRGKQCKIRDGLTKKDKIFTISSKLSFNVVILSDQNIKAEILRDHRKKIGSLGADVGLFILSGREHPNTYGFTPDELLKRIDIKNEAFNELIEKLRR
ncbi:MAG: hypothetical protein UV40_C0004G0001 [Parcubacteria group bacterium GW2011_GWA1_42_7]|nr:MAG: hypothetical protein UV40_C0004G0001 [Parcubacteria group bacterium GW2011_GWA1_42_7]KKS91809.1 MAG: hypothetical protein UV67_C0017G0004 [Parcubacteria group bacterium GW2011_GWC1_43_12]